MAGKDEEKKKKSSSSGAASDKKKVWLPAAPATAANI